MHTYSRRWPKQAAGLVVVGGTSMHATDLLTHHFSREGHCSFDRAVESSSMYSTHWRCWYIHGYRTSVGQVE
jgi:hypothetical protein